MRIDRGTKEQALDMLPRRDSTPLGRIESGAIPLDRLGTESRLVCAATAVCSPWHRVPIEGNVKPVVRPHRGPRFALCAHIRSRSWANRETAPDDFSINGQRSDVIDPKQFGNTLCRVRALQQRKGVPNGWSWRISSKHHCVCGGSGSRLGSDCSAQSAWLQRQQGRLDSDGCGRGRRRTFNHRDACRKCASAADRRR